MTDPGLEVTERIGTEEAQNQSGGEEGDNGEEHDHVGDNDEFVTTKSQRCCAWFLTDILIYILVLNLAAEFVEQIVIDHFSISIFAAVVLKLVIEAIHSAQHFIEDVFCVKLKLKILGAFFIWFILFLSKFVILWIDDAIFGSHVQLGSIWSILLLSLVLVTAALSSRFLFHKLGVWDRAKEMDSEKEAVGEVVPEDEDVPAVDERDAEQI